MSAEDDMDRDPEAGAPAAEETPSAGPVAAKARRGAKASPASKPVAKKPTEAKPAAAKTPAEKGPTAEEAEKGPTADKAKKGPTAGKEKKGPTAGKEKGSAAGKESAGSSRKRVPRLGKAKKQPPPRRVVRAYARYVRTSARKARMVCGHLRGKSVQEARAILAFTPRDVARDWSKLLESAVANAESNHELLEDDLIIREAYADEGPTIKRFRPRAMGRATPIRKRTSHLTITLTPGQTPNTDRQG
jgi:ribosomal protein L22